MARGHKLVAVIGVACTFVCIGVDGIGVGGIGMVPTRAVADELAEDQVIVAFEPQLTGEAARDFARRVAIDDTFTVYLIAGALAVPTRGFSFSLGISEAANIAVSEVRSFGDVFVDQNSIGTVLSVSVILETGCFDRDVQAILAEIDLVRLGIEVPLQIQLGGFPYAPQQSPEYLDCQGAAVAFDDSLAQQLAVQVPAPVPVAQQTWAVVKDLYRSP
jgi:hypothetical protein